MRRLKTKKSPSRSKAKVKKASPKPKRPTVRKSARPAALPVRRSLGEGGKPAKVSPKAKAAKPGVFEPEIRVHSTPETLYQESAHLFMRIARESADTRGRFVAALSGGSTPKGLFQQLTEEPYRTLIPWDKTFFFWVDERHVPLTDGTSNYRMAQEYLLSKVPVPKENLFPATNGSQPVDQAASSYEIKLRKFFGGDSVPVFDLCLMGMGEDGHTASLFPGFPQVNEMEKWVVGYFVDEARKERVSLTFPVLNAARLLMVLVEGEKKAAMVKEALEGSSEPPRFPIQYLRPADGRLVYAMDAAAASAMKRQL